MPVPLQLSTGLLAQNPTIGQQYTQAQYNAMSPSQLLRIASSNTGIQLAQIALGGNKGAGSVAENYYRQTAFAPQFSLPGAAAAMGGNINDLNRLLNFTGGAGLTPQQRAMQFVYMAAPALQPQQVRQGVVNSVFVSAPSGSTGYDPGKALLSRVLGLLGF